MNHEPLRELLLDIIDRFATYYKQPPTAVVRKVYADVQRQWAGQTIYIPRRGETEISQMHARNNAIIEDARRGEHAELLSRRYGISVRRIQQILAERNSLP